MDKRQALLITAVAVFSLAFVLPMALGSLEYGFDLPLIGHITLIDFSEMFEASSFLVGGALAAVFMYVMVTEIKKRRQRT